MPDPQRTHFATTPAATPLPTAPPARRKRPRAGASSGPVAQGFPSCDNVGNTVLSCFPTDNTTLVQGTYSRFIWNANYPTFIAANNSIDVYLFHADSMQIARNWTRLPNDQGMCAILPDDDWWGARREAQELPVGRNRTWGYYFVVVPSGETLDGGETHQNTFSAVQTSPPRSVLASLSLASASSASLASLSTSLSTTRSTTATSTGSLQNGLGPPQASSFPKWAIAVIVILGVLLLLTLLGIFIVLLRRRSSRTEDQDRTRRPHEPTPSDGTGTSATHVTAAKAARQQSYDEKPVHEPRHPHSVTPGPTIPVLASQQHDRQRYTPSPNALPSTTHIRPQSRTSLYPPLATSPPPPPPVGAQIARQRSGSTSDHLPSPNSARLSGSEAAAVADAFRQAMRKPDFADIPTEEGESPDSETQAARGLMPITPSRIMQRELSGEGVVPRAVNRRAYQVEGTDEDQ